MSFPIDHQEAVCWLATTRNEKPLIDAIVRIAIAELQEARASTVEVQGNRIQFTVRWFRWVSNWNRLTNIDKGAIEITPQAGTLCVEYYLSFKRILVQHCLLLLFAVSFVTLPDRGLPTTMRVLAPLLLFSAVFSLNYVIAVRRFARLIKRIIARANLESAGVE